MEAFRVSLYDIELRSLAAAESERVAAALAQLRVAPSLEAARSMLSTTPVILARYVRQEGADMVLASLKPTGADVFLKSSRLTCPHCGCSMPCEGEARSGRDAVFSCRACAGLILLDWRDRKFHPVLPCPACRSLVHLPSKLKEGSYPCACGKTLTYSPIWRARQAAHQEAPEPEHVLSKHKEWVYRKQWVFPTLSFLGMAVVWFWLLAVPRTGLQWPGDQSVANANDQPRATDAYRRFNAMTNQVAVIAALGAPEKESATKDGALKVLFYRRYNLCVVLRGDAAGNAYVRTARITDGFVLHERP